MKRRTFLWSLACGALLAHCMRDDVNPDGKTLELITTRLYDDFYSPLRSASGKESAREEIARQLLPYSLQEAVDNGIIPWDLKGYTLPLGMWNRSRTVNFIQGMEDMWNDKEGIDKKSQHGRMLRERRDYFVNLMQGRTVPTTLGEYQRQLTAGCLSLQTLLARRRDMYGPKKVALLELIIDHFNENCFLSYTLQELLTPSYHGNDINPLFKIYFFDHLLQEAGLGFIEGYPARHDHHLSHGPFQLTNVAVADVQKYDVNFEKDEIVPRALEQFKGIYDHVRAAALFAYANWERVADNLITEEKKTKLPFSSSFIDIFPSLDQTTRYAFVAGMSGCLHHLPTRTRKIVAKKSKRNCNISTRTFRDARDVCRRWTARAIF
ncbi:hypothetical protein HYW21_01810 [Candidatus Woesearchaeota archaeon]|nr:hypothetical protein [Candidatus Woesearchaeota archaeon]